MVFDSQQYFPKYARDTKPDTFDNFVYLFEEK